ncbi:MAG TPA: glycine cleavage system aminomethyltransferase GcvT, partial [Thermoanaerobaculia bacterium]|nr:glycine cleavage system aminomethyltransferase GcvT [Thermoanaerobaculia bacterium]
MAVEAAAARTPLHDCHRRAGARMVEFAGWEMPVHYSGVMQEHRAVRQAAGLFDVSHMGEIAVRGPRAVELVERLTPNHVARLPVGRAHYSGLLTERGTYLDDLLVYRLGEEDLLLVVNAANREEDVEWVRDRAFSSGVTVEDASERYALLALQGPAAAAILAPLTPLDLDALGYYGFAPSEVAGRPAL